MMPSGMEFQNIVSKYVPEGTVWVMKYDWKWSLNAKPTPITEKYYIMSRVKLTVDQCIIAISKYLEKEYENGRS